MIKRNCLICDKGFYVIPHIISKGGGKLCSRACLVIYKTGVPINLSEKNPMWKGKLAGSVSIHKWVQKRKPKPEFCENCKEKPPYDLANISPKYNPETYTRKIENWEWLCRGCHMKKDGRRKRLIERNQTAFSRKRFYCSIENCNRKHIALNLCDLHYRRQRRQQKKEFISRS